jgi:hypothetical protein
MDSRATRLILAISALAMAAPVWAARNESVSVSFDHRVTVDGKAIQPGRYVFEAKPNDTTIQILRKPDDKLIATVEGTWVALNSKPRQTQVQTDKNFVEEIDFGGKTQAIRFMQN